MTEGIYFLNFNLYNEILRYNIPYPIGQANRYCLSVTNFQTRPLTLNTWLLWNKRIRWIYPVSNIFLFSYRNHYRDIKINWRIIVINCCYWNTQNTINLYSSEMISSIYIGNTCAYVKNWVCNQIFHDKNVLRMQLLLLIYIYEGIMTLYKITAKYLRIVEKQNFDTSQYD